VLLGAVGGASAGVLVWGVGAWGAFSAQWGHEWVSAVHERTAVAPRATWLLACAQARRVVLAVPSGERSFGALYPTSFPSGWHPTRNGDLDPYVVKPHSDRKGLVALRRVRPRVGGHLQGPDPHSGRGGCPS
jgi:hypothetical protein